MMNYRGMNRLWESLVAFLFFFGIDRFSKFFILKTSGHINLTSFLSIDITVNRGIAWGLFHTASTWGFILVSAIIFAIICAMLWYTYQQIGRGKLATEEMLILAGAIGNLVDRIIYSGVIDFIQIHFGDWFFPTFNLADVFIVLGVMMVLFKHYDS